MFVTSLLLLVFMEEECDSFPLVHQNSTFVRSGINNPSSPTLIIVIASVAIIMLLKNHTHHGDCSR